jgi:hypothetical protein
VLFSRAGSELIPRCAVGLVAFPLLQVPLQARVDFHTERGMCLGWEVGLGGCSKHKGAAGRVLSGFVVGLHGVQAASA